MDNYRQAPEIDAASGTTAIALLSGVLLLAGERVRSKRSSKSDE
ncbi:VPEID-CTERM sorting domain-containing protein [Methylobacter sp. S3L5C]|nr:VPEID-CTERM sorting domain-containing protein [Methylobacter sp. S3L5C]